MEGTKFGGRFFKHIHKRFSNKRDDKKEMSSQEFQTKKAQVKSVNSVK